MIMNPPTISFASANGPSVTPEAVTTLPDGFSWLPISRMLCLNVSFHALKAANISCIWAGEGLFWLGAPRYMQRYFWVGIGSPIVAPISGASSIRRAKRGESDTLKRFFSLWSLLTLLFGDGMSPILRRADGGTWTDGSELSALGSLATPLDHHRFASLFQGLAAADFFAG